MIINYQNNVNISELTEYLVFSCYLYNYILYIAGIFPIIWQTKEIPCLVCLFKGCIIV